jgi:hypothetical protein
VNRKRKYCLLFYKMKWLSIALRTNNISSKCRVNINYQTYSIEEIRRYLDNIYENEYISFQGNIPFGLILQHHETGEYRYLNAYTNKILLDSLLTISNRLDKSRCYVDKI